MNTIGLEKRIEKLEHGNGHDAEFLKVEALEHVLDSAEPDEVKAFEAVIEELIALQECGFDEEAIAGMMGERWPKVLDLMERAETEIESLRSQRRRKVGD